MCRWRTRPAQVACSGMCRACPVHVGHLLVQPPISARLADCGAVADNGIFCPVDSE